MVGPLAAGAGGGALPSSRGAPGAGCSRPMGAGDSRTSGALGGVVPERARRARRVRIGVRIKRVRPPRPWRGARLIRGQRRLGDVRVPRRAAGAIAEAEFNILAEFLQLRLEPMLGVLQFLDPAVGPAQVFLEPVDTDDEAGGVVWIVWRAVRDVRRRRRLTVEDIELRLSRRRQSKTAGQRRDQTQAKQRRHGRLPGGIRFEWPIRPASVDFKLRRELRAPPSAGELNCCLGRH